MGDWKKPDFGDRDYYNKYWSGYSSFEEARRHKKEIEEQMNRRKKGERNESKIKRGTDLQRNSEKIS